MTDVDLIGAPTVDVRAAQVLLREQLWMLVPAWMRSADAPSGVLEAIVDVLSSAGAVVADDLDGLSDDWFIETCSEWLVPYIGDLVGVRRLHPLEAGSELSNRALVADTIRFRRRKGTAAVLEDVARASTGWPAKVTEFFEVIATTQHLDHVRLHAPGFAAVRDSEPMGRIGTPFEAACRTIDVRALGRQATRGVGSGHNLPNVGIHVWPLASYPLEQVTAAPVTDPGDGRWFVDPSGRDRHLAGPTVADGGIGDRATAATTPGLLRRRPLHDELDAQRAAPVDETRLTWFQADDPAFRVWIQETAADELEPLPLELLHVCNLSSWDRPTGSRVRVDPVLGRVTVAAARTVHRLAVSWSFARAGRVGAGPWPRRSVGGIGVRSDGQFDDAQFVVGVGAASGPADELLPTLGDAVVEWHNFQAANPGATGRIVITDSHRYVEAFTGGGRIEIGQGARLEIVAAAWPQPPNGPRVVDGIERVGVLPTIVGDIDVVGTGSGDTPGALVIEGLSLVGGLDVLPAGAATDGLGAIELRCCTLVPAPGDDTPSATTIGGDNDRAEVRIDRCLIGALTVASAIPIEISDSVVHGTGAAIDAPTSDLTVAGITAVGTTTTARLTADDSIFDGLVTVARRQQGCVRFCYVAPGSITPHRYRCQPDLGPTSAERLVPTYQSIELVEPGYAQLAPGAAWELRTGASGGAEMGAFRRALTAKRLANLAAALDEYLPLGRVADALPVLPNTALLHEGGQS